MYFLVFELLDCSWLALDIQRKGWDGRELLLRLSQDQIHLSGNAVWVLRPRLWIGKRDS